MSGLAYVGIAPTLDFHIVNKLAVDAQIATTNPSQTSVQGQINALVGGTYATKSYVDTQDATFQSTTYYQTQDALNVPTSSVGQPNGVATLNSSSKVPLAQVPTLGAPYVVGPFGPTAIFTGTTTSTPFKMADFNIGVQTLAFQPVVFGHFWVSGTAKARPVVEIRIANTTTSPTYGSTTLVARGMGREHWTGYQPITVFPAGATTGMTPSNLSTSYNIWLTAWVFDLNNDGVTVINSSVASGAAWIIRQAQ